MDPRKKYYDVGYKELMADIKKNSEPKVAAIDSGGPGGIKYESRGLKYDRCLEDFILGTSGRLSDWSRESNTDVPLIIRGLGSGSKKAIIHCWETNRTFYAMDSGYFGNKKIKKWHRITKNNLQNLGPIIERPSDRLELMGYKFKKFTDGKKILICPPSEKVMNLFGQVPPEEWVANTIEELKQYTDRPIEIRLKPNRSERVSTNTIEQALADDVHCLITYNSIAAVEALMFGKPAIALGPNAAQVLCNSKLSDVENLYKPAKDEMFAFVKHLSYAQFSREDMLNGTAWRILNEDSELSQSSSSIE